MKSVITPWPLRAPMMLAKRKIQAFMPKEWQYQEIRASQASLLAPYTDIGSRGYNSPASG